MRKVLILLAGILLLTATGLKASGDKGFLYYDTTSYRLYNEGKWHELIRIGKEALSYDYDYYYMRMRIGIAYYNLRKFHQAMPHFERAAEMNPVNHDPVIYSYYCALETGRTMLAVRSLRSLPHHKQEEIEASTPLQRNRIELESGPLISTATNLNALQNPDGPANIFGEAIVPAGGYYNALLYSFYPGGTISFKLAAIHLSGDNTHRAFVSNYPALNRKEHYQQAEGYFSAQLHLGGGFYLHPAYHYAHLAYDFTDVQYDAFSGQVLIQKGNVTRHQHIGCLSIDKTAGPFVVSLAGAYSDILGAEQFQFSAAITTYPLGNLDLYTHSKLISHENDSKQEILFHQLVGFRIAGFLWADLYGTFGRMINYHDEHGYVIYNSGKEMTFLGGGRLYFVVNDRITFSFEFKGMKIEDEIIRYKPGPGNISEPGFIPVIYWNNMFLGGLQWKF